MYYCKSVSNQMVTHGQFIKDVSSNSPNFWALQKVTDRYWQWLKYWHHSFSEFEKLNKSTLRFLFSVIFFFLENKRNKKTLFKLARNFNRIVSRLTGNSESQDPTGRQLRKVLRNDLTAEVRGCRGRQEFVWVNTILGQHRRFRSSTTRH